MSSRLFIPELKFLGNREILNNHKVGFLCSRKVTAEIILKTYDWAVEQRDRGVCIVSGFHSKIEKDVFEILVRGKQPIIIILARGMMKRWQKNIIEAVNQNRLLIISPFNESVKRITNETAVKRNELLIELSDEIFIAYHTKDGMIQNVIRSKAGLKNITNL